MCGEVRKAMNRQQVIIKSAVDSEALEGEELEVGSF